MLSCPPATTISERFSMSYCREKAQLIHQVGTDFYRIVKQSLRVAQRFKVKQIGRNLAHPEGCIVCAE